MTGPRAATADLASIDRDVARAYRAWSRWRERLGSDPDANADDEPLEPFRHVAGQTTYNELAALDVLPHEAALRDALVRWVHALLQARLGHELDVAWARAAVDPIGRFRGESPRLVSWRDAWRGVVSSANASEADRWLEAAADCAPPLDAALRERARRRLEIARRLGLASDASDATPAPLEAIRDAARTLLSRTDDIAASVLREGRSDRARPRASDAIMLAVARDAGDGWPARLAPRWLDEHFGEGARGLDIALPPLPEAVGASSFARALGLFGYAFRVASGARSPRFALAREPSFVAAHRFAFVFASLPTSPDFHRVALGTTRRVAVAQARALTRTALIDARLHAMRIVLDEDRTNRRTDLFEELGVRVLGAPLPSAFAGAWPAPRADEPARMLALMTTLPLLRDLVDRFDVDWFKNPRALPHLRAIGAVPAREETVTVDVATSIDSLARAFEEALA